MACHGRPLLPCETITQYPRYLRSEVTDVAEGLQFHKMVHFDHLWLAYTINDIAREIQQHYMLCPIFLRVQQLLAKLLVLCDKG
jgi:protein-arginine kinase